MGAFFSPVLPYLTENLPLTMPQGLPDAEPSTRSYSLLSRLLPVKGADKHSQGISSPDGLDSLKPKPTDRGGRQFGVWPRVGHSCGVSTQEILSISDVGWEESIPKGPKISCCILWPRHVDPRNAWKQVAGVAPGIIRIQLVCSVDIPQSGKDHEECHRCVENRSVVEEYGF